MINRVERRIVFITQWAYNDALIQAYTLPYIYIINRVSGSACYLVCVNKDIHRIRVKKKQRLVLIELPSNEGGLFLGWFRNIIFLNKIIKRKKITDIHPWCTPAGAVGVILKLMNKRLRLTIDSFEPHAEAMVENKTWSRSGLKYKLLLYMEKLEARKAQHLIFAAEGMQDYVLRRYRIRVSDYYVKPACVDLEKFSINEVKNEGLLRELNLAGKIVCVYAGKFGGIYLEGETFGFIKKCEEYWGADKFRFLLLSNISDEYVKEKESEHGIAQSTIIKLFVPHAEVAKYMGLADFAVCPVKPVPTKRYATPIKNGEYWAMGLPIVITPNISTDSDIIVQHNAGAVIENLDDKGYLKAIEKINSIITGKSRAEVYTQVRPVAEKYRNFKIAEKVYTSIYASA